MSRHIDCLMYANEMNKFSSLDKKLQYDFFINIIRKKKRFSPWLKQEKIKALLQENGYQQIFEGETFWDDWYLHNSLYNELKQKGRLIEKQH